MFVFSFSLPCGLVDVAALGWALSGLSWRDARSACISSVWSELCVFSAMHERALRRFVCMRLRGSQAMNSKARGSPQKPNGSTGAVLTFLEKRGGHAFGALGIKIASGTFPPKTVMSGIAARVPFVFSKTDHPVVVALFARYMLALDHAAGVGSKRSKPEESIAFMAQGQKVISRWSLLPSTPDANAIATSSPCLDDEQKLI